MRRYLFTVALCAAAAAVFACNNGAAVSAASADDPTPQAEVAIQAPAPGAAPESAAAQPSTAAQARPAQRPAARPGTARQAAGADWPWWRGPARNGISPETGIRKDWQSAPPRKLWSVALGDGGYAGPAAADGKVFVIDHSGNRDVVRAIDLQTGRDVWTYPYDDTAQANYGYARSTPAYAAGRLYTFSRLGVLHCLDGKSGKLVWKRDLATEYGAKRPGWDLAGSPLVDGARIVVCPGGQNAAVVAVDAVSGKTLMQGGGDQVAGYATPVAATIDGKKQYVLFNAKNASGVDAATGQVLWTHNWETSYDVNAATPIVIGSSVFITSGYGRGSALLDVKGSSVSERWSSREVVSRFTTPILWQGSLYCTSESGALTCLDPNTGRARWKQPGFEWGGLVGVDGVLIVQSGSNGDTAMVQASPDAFKELGRFTPLGGQSWTAPIVARGCLIVRNKGQLACFSLR